MRKAQKRAIATKRINNFGKKKFLKSGKSMAHREK
jgi:hypothetical protein